MHDNTFVKEKSYIYIRFWFILVITIVTFLFLGFQSKGINSSELVLKISLVSLTFFSMFYYRFIIKFPDVMVDIRKSFILLLDFTFLTFVILLLKSFGLFLFPIYIIIIMLSSANFGFMYFYISLLFASLSWVFLVQVSFYWDVHSDIVSLYALTAFIVSFIYSKHLWYLYEEQEVLSETLEHSTYDANFDTLTHLPNRKQYHSYMKELFAEEAFFALLFIDLNKFKPINDTYGHDIGDKVLIEVAKRLSSSLEEEDFIARLGGDEFVIITKRKKAFLDKFLQKLVSETIGGFIVQNKDIFISLSVGVSIYPEDSTSETFLRKCADEAMYIAKQDENRSYVFYSEIKELS